jgi:hypothetical protein
MAKDCSFHLRALDAVRLTAILAAGMPTETIFANCALMGGRREPSPIKGRGLPTGPRSESRYRQS